MAYVCYKPAGSCKTCQHYRWDEDSNRMCCWAKFDEENKNMLQDFSFIVQCNDAPAIKINVVAENCDKAKAYVKNMYAAQYPTYADDRFNNWLIKEV